MNAQFGEKYAFSGRNTERFLFTLNGKIGDIPPLHIEADGVFLSQFHGVTSLPYYINLNTMLAVPISGLNRFHGLFPDSWI